MGKLYLDTEVWLLWRCFNDAPLVDRQPHGPLVHVYFCVSQSQEVPLLHEFNCSQTLLAQERQSVLRAEGMRCLAIAEMLAACTVSVHRKDRFAQWDPSVQAAGCDMDGIGFGKSCGADSKLWEGTYDRSSQSLPCSFLAVRMMQPVGSPTRHSAIVAGFVFGRDGLCKTSLWLNTCTRNA